MRANTGHFTTDFEQLNRNERREKIIAANKAKRARQLKNRTIAAAIVLTFVLVSVLSFTFGSLFAQAKSNVQKEEIKCYSSVMIGYGESVESVIEANYDTTHYSSLTSFRKEVYEINSLEDGFDITPGMCIVLPYYTEL